MAHLLQIAYHVIHPYIYKVIFIFFYYFFLNIIFFFYYNILKINLTKFKFIIIIKFKSLIYK